MQFRSWFEIQNNNIGDKTIVVKIINIFSMTQKYIIGKNILFFSQLQFLCSISFNIKTCFEVLISSLSRSLDFPCCDTSKSSFRWYGSKQEGLFVFIHFKIFSSSHDGTGWVHSVIHLKSIEMPQLFTINKTKNQIHFHQQSQLTELRLPEKTVSRDFCYD